MKNFFIFCALLLIGTTLTIGVGAGEEPWFPIAAEQAEAQLVADDPLPYFREGFTQFLLDNPTMAKFFASELNLNNGWVGWPGREDVGEKYMFGRTLNSTIAQTIEVEGMRPQQESARLLFGPWYGRKAYTYSTPKNLGWFPWHLDLLTGVWYKTDPRSPDLGIRVFHYTDYEFRNRTTTLGVFFDRECEIEGAYWCRITIIRKTPAQ